MGADRLRRPPLSRQFASSVSLSGSIRAPVVRMGQCSRISPPMARAPPRRGWDMGCCSSCLGHGDGRASGSAHPARRTGMLPGIARACLQSGDGRPSCTLSQHSPRRPARRTWQLHGNRHGDGERPWVTGARGDVGCQHRRPCSGASARVRADACLRPAAHAVAAVTGSGDGPGPCGPAGAGHHARCSG